MKDFWDQRYAEEGFVYGHEPNEFFRREIEKLIPGRLLLPGEGEGRNAAFAASLGWEVVAFDQSIQGKKKAMELAKRNTVSFDYLVADIEAFSAEEETFDCLAIIFVHFPERERKRLHQKLLAFLKPGGTFIMEVFSKDQLGRKSGGPQHPELLYTEQDMTEDFGHLKELQIAATETQLKEGRYHEGTAAVIRLTGRK
ncbi:MAG: class I SAM-dependent methyltransferase [Bacteroidales bacterium]|nr:class I SAM-dependent methyltransferase [Bacteroidales bacterium]